MDDVYENVELVCVASGFRLFDADSYQRTYRRPDGVALVPGMYVVHWPGNATSRRFDEDAVFYGPFPDSVSARAAMAELLRQLGALESSTQKIAASKRVGARVDAALTNAGGAA